MTTENPLKILVSVLHRRTSAAFDDLTSSQSRSVSAKREARHD
ncbi:hypothetical protein [Pseudomonas asiatica]|nr:hypothetical protein [Pseudomonas asiatica]MDM9554786.1 hypothetical protein [Pseudomonas asiatica]